MMTWSTAPLPTDHSTAAASASSSTAMRTRRSVIPGAAHQPFQVGRQEGMAISSLPVKQFQIKLFCHEKQNPSSSVPGTDKIKFLHISNLQQ